MGPLKSKHTSITTVRYPIVSVDRLPTPLIFRYPLPLKRHVAGDGFFIIPSYPGYDSKDFNFSQFWTNFGCIQRTRRVRQDFSTTYRTPQGQYFNHGRRDIISKPQENKMQLKFFVCPTGKYHSVQSPYALNELNLALTW